MTPTVFLSDGLDFTVPGGAIWILANPDWKAFYRVNYNAENWDELVTQLESDHEVSLPCIGNWSY